MYSAGAADVDDAGYSTIEGGLGWWTHNRFGTDTAKFVMGGVAREFVEWANGPGAGGGSADVDRRDWRTPQGKYGVAQLSPNVLWAPDGLNLAPGLNGELFGYGYHPLSIVPADTASADTASADAGDSTVGDRSWTLFLNTANFRGPVSFFVPDFFAAPGRDDPAVAGAYLDANGAEWDGYVGMETPIFPAAHGVADGASYVRIAPTQFPASDDESSVLVHRVTAYGDAALRDPMSAWWAGGPRPGSSLDADAAVVAAFDRISAGESSTYTFVGLGVTNEDGTESPIDWELLADVDHRDPQSFRYRWNLDLVDRVGDSFVIPEYYRLDDGPQGAHWRAVEPAEVPASTGLLNHRFEPLGEVDLGDGSTVTYHWYRFVDQPAIRHHGFTDEQLSELQRRVVALHRWWAPDTAPFPDPTVGELASLDPAILVEPPAGMEFGYVPIVVRQERTR